MPRLPTSRKQAAASPPIAAAASGGTDAPLSPTIQTTRGASPEPEPSATDALGWLETALRVALRFGAAATAACSLIWSLRLLRGQSPLSFDSKTGVSGSIFPPGDRP